MYTHLSKGFTIGAALTRRLFRNIFGFPGFLIDAIIFAPLFSLQGNYLDYWREKDWRGETDFYYLDGTKVIGFGFLITSYLADIIGAAIGYVLGTLIGLSCYVIDMSLQLAVEGYRKIQDGLTLYAEWLSVGAKLPLTYSHPDWYFSKAWNISVGTLGLILGGIPFILARTVEFFLPLPEHYLSNFLGAMGCYISGIIGFAPALIWAPVNHIFNKLTDLFYQAREWVRSGAALAYALTNSKPLTGEEAMSECCLPPEALHGKEFCEQVDYFSQNFNKNNPSLNTSTVIIGESIPVAREVSQSSIENPTTLKTRSRSSTHTPPPQTNPGADTTTRHYPNIIPSAPPGDKMDNDSAYPKLTSHIQRM